jgi:indolepyruvate ferredoxin oxidoreductase alpha subunit
MVMADAFRLSEETGQPVMVRITRALSLAQAQTEGGEANTSSSELPPPPYRREFMRWVVLPVNVVANHRKLHERLEKVRSRFGTSGLNSVQGTGPLGVIAAGFSHQKLIEALGSSVPADLSILQLSTLSPFPAEKVTAWLRNVQTVLVLEETAPWVERFVRASAQASGLTLPIYGRDTGHIPRTGEIFAPGIARALNRPMPHLSLPTEGPETRPMPSRQGLCDACPYIPVFDALLAEMERLGGRDQFVVIGDPGCMVRAQLPPYRLLDVKNSLGSSIGQAAGFAIGMARCKRNAPMGIASDGKEGGPVPDPAAEPPAKRVVALSGDSSFVHSGFAGLVDLCRSPEAAAQVLVIILDNGTTALSGGQPHPGSQTNARGNAQPAVDLAALARDAGAGWVRVVNVTRGKDLRDAIRDGLTYGSTGTGTPADRLAGAAVLVARGPCPHWLEPQ